MGYGLSLVLDYPYEKVLSRSVLLLAALGLIPLWRLYGLDAHQIGLRPVAPDRRQMLAAYTWGIGILLPPMLFFLTIGFRVWDPRLDFASLGLLRDFVVIFSSAWLVAVFEETLFRGVMFSAMRKQGGWLGAALVTSVLYGVVHFLAPPEHTWVNPSWLTGLQVVFSSLSALVGGAGDWSSFVSLVLLGLSFCWVREHYGLWAAIALHSALVCALRVFKALTVRDIVHPWKFLVGEYDNFVGIAVIVWLIFGFVCVALWRRHQRELS